MTPYLHVFVNHVPYFMRKYGSLYPFQMEEVEQLNYIHKLVFYRSSNHGRDDFSVTQQVKFVELLKRNLPEEMIKGRTCAHFHHQNLIESDLKS